MFLLISCALFSLLLLPRISIHLMFLLIRELDQKVRKQIDYFNTSYVFINHEAMTMKSWKNPISIHLMFLLILRPSLRPEPRSDYFNTSHVSINLCGPLREKRSEAHFNTSHVSINLSGMAGSNSKLYNFNTSHVSINPGCKSYGISKELFQYISCFY